MPDIDSGKVGKEISKPDQASRVDAMNALSTAMQGAKPADIKTLADNVSKNIDLHALGLDGFHLDQSTPVDKLHIPAKDADAAALANHTTPNHKDIDIPYIKFTNGTKSIGLVRQGAEFDLSNGQQLRPEDAPSKPATTPGDATPPAAKPDATTPKTDATTPKTDAPSTPVDASTLSDADKAKIQQFIQKNVDDQSVSAPVKRGEGYYQVIRRMNPTMSPEDAVKAARHMRDLNGGNTNLKVGDKLPLMSDADKKTAFQDTMDKFSKLPADIQAQTLAAAKLAFPDTPSTPGAPTDAPTAPAPAPGAAVKPGDTTAPAPKPATKPGDATTPPPAPGPATAKLEATPPAPKPAAKPGDGSSPDTPLDPSTPPDLTPPPVVGKVPDATPAPTPDAGTWAPTLDPTSKDLQPKGDASKPETLLYNPLAPIGLSEGQPGQQLKKTTEGVDSRQITAGKDANSESVAGKIADGSLFSLHWFDTSFTTQDTMQNGKLATRDTKYDSDRVNLKFQGAAGQDPVAINGVKEVLTTLSGDNGYTTTVKDSNGKQWIFQSDEKGVVLDAKANT